MVSLSYETKNKDSFRNILKKDIPLVFFDRVFECTNCVNVIIDNFRAGYEATKHLIEQGCKKIIHVGGSMNRNVYNDRFLGYRQALAENSLEFDNYSHIITDLMDSSVEVIIRKLLSRGSMPDGIFTANDTTAVALICELKRKRLPCSRRCGCCRFQ